MAEAMKQSEIEAQKELKAAKEAMMQAQKNAERAQHQSDEKKEQVEKSDSNLVVELKKRLYEQTVETEALQQKLEAANQQVIENKRMYETLMYAFKQHEQSQGAETEQRQYLVDLNKQLKQQNERDEQRLYKMEVKVENLKRYKNMIQSSTSMQCKYCDSSI